ncbi:hypothetical protein LMT13_03495 [Escherichia coli]|nr:hypothetical protein [Escherichia coli]
MKFPLSFISKIPQII